MLSTDDLDILRIFHDQRKLRRQSGGGRKDTNESFENVTFKEINRLVFYFSIIDLKINQKKLVETSSGKRSIEK